MVLFLSFVPYVLGKTAEGLQIFCSLAEKKHICEPICFICYGW